MIRFKMTSIAAGVFAMVSISVGAQQLPSGSVPVGQPATPVVAQPQFAGLPAGAQVGPQTAPVVGAPLPLGQQATAPQNLPPLPAAMQTVPNFEEILNQTLGLTPDQIKELRRQQNLRQKAASELPMTPPKPVTSTVQASSAPGSVAPVIRAFSGFASAVTVMDSTGALWPIENFVVGHEKLFEVKRLDGEKGSMLSIVPLSNYGQTNMLVYLKGMSPIVLSLISGQKEVDFRTDVRVQGLGPNAQVAVGGLPASTNPFLYTVLEGVPPVDSRELKVNGGDARAWLSKAGLMYLRTPLKVISPSWIGSARAPDGMSAYEMKPANSIRIIRDGKIETIGVEGW